MSVDVPQPLVVPLEAYPHLFVAVGAEQDRIAVIAAELNAREDAGEVDPPWPEDFDVNDLSIYDMIWEELERASASESRTVHFGSAKFYWFLTMVIPAYVSANRATLTTSEVAALKAIYDQRPRPDLRPWPSDL
jgi:hypothetical protein